MKIGTTQPPLGLDKRGRPFHLHRRTAPMKRRARADAKAKAEGARLAPFECSFKFPAGPHSRAHRGILFHSRYEQLDEMQRIEGIVQRIHDELVAPASRRRDGETDRPELRTTG